MKMNVQKLGEISLQDATHITAARAADDMGEERADWNLGSFIDVDSGGRVGCDGSLDMDELKVRWDEAVAGREIGPERPIAPALPRSEAFEEYWLLFIVSVRERGILGR